MEHQLTWHRISRFAVVMAVLGVLAFAAGADWFGASSVSGSSSHVNNGHHAH